MSTAPSTPRPSVMQLAIKEKAALYAAYIPMFAEGGVFVPTQREYRLGDDVYVLLTLPDEPQRYPVAGRVAWITPARASGNRTQGIGIQFPKDEKSAELKAKIENILGAALDLGYYISMSGIVTFKNAQHLRDVAAFVPADRLLIETDSPYLAPVPYRGKTNNPSYVPYVAQQIAQVRGIPVEEVAALTSANFDQLFKGVVA